MKFAILADSHIGRSIPLAIAEHRRKAFSRSFSKAVDVIVEAGVDYIFICGDLFERRTLRPNLVQFAHDELYRLAQMTKKRHGKNVKILVIRGNHDGRPHSNTLDYIKHPLAEYLHIFDDDAMVFRDENIYVVGLNYYDKIDLAFERLVKPAFKEEKGLRILMIHGFVSGFNKVPPYSSYLTMDDLASIDPAFVFTGHYHRRCPPRMLPNGGWILTPGSLEMYDFAEKPEKGFYIVDSAESEPKFQWMPIESMHIMKQVKVEADRRREPSWYKDRILEEVLTFKMELKKAGKPGYIRVRAEGRLKDGYPGDIDLTSIREHVDSDELLIWVDIDTLRLEIPLLASISEKERVDIREFFDVFGEFAEDIEEMHVKIREILEEEASLQTGLLTPGQRLPLVNEWLDRFEKRKFGDEKI